MATMKGQFRRRWFYLPIMGLALTLCGPIHPLLAFTSPGTADMPEAISVEGRRVLPVGFWRYAGGDTALDEGLAEPVRVIALVAQQRFALGKRVNHERGPLVVAHLSFAEQQDDRATLTVTDGMKLGVQASLGASDTAGNSPFFRRLAAVRCALRWVASIITWSARAAKIRLNTPRRLHRMKRL